MSCPKKIKEALENIGYIEIDSKWHGEGKIWEWEDLVEICLKVFKYKNVA